MEADKENQSRLEQQLVEEFDAYFVVAFSRALRIVKDIHPAEDLAYEAIIRLLGKVREGEKIKNMRAYLSRIASNMAFDHQKAKNPLVVRLLSLEDEKGIMGEQAAFYETGMDEDSILHCLQEQLTPTQYKVFFPHFEYGLDAEQIAELLGQSRKYVQDYLSIARKRAMACLSSYQSDPN